MVHKTHLEKHGAYRTPTYKTWQCMRYRCLNVSPETARYNGRGITICPEWQESFLAFLRDMGPRPPGMTIERKDNNKGYFKDNCRWATRWAQSLNRGTTVTLTVDGRTQSIGAWAKETGLPYSMVYCRKKAGWSDAMCLTPTRQKKERTLVWRGKRISVARIAKQLGVAPSSIHVRIRNGWSVEDIVTRPNSQPHQKLRFQ